MENRHAHKLTFCAWLVKQLKVTRWSIIAGERLQDLANRLGVNLEVRNKPLKSAPKS